MYAYMYMYLDVHVHMHMYFRIDMDMDMYMYICVFSYISTSTCTPAHTIRCTSAMHICMHRHSVYEIGLAQHTHIRTYITVTLNVSETEVSRSFEGMPTNYNYMRNFISARLFINHIFADCQASVILHSRRCRCSVRWFFIFVFFVFKINFPA